MSKQPAFLSRPLDQMTQKEWESLCDGCGLCCQVRVEDIDTGEIALSNVACRYLDLCNHQCTDYPNRLKNVANCIEVTPQNIHTLHWLPYSCGYRLAFHGEPLPEWHHLICGDKQRVHDEGISMIGMLVSEENADWNQSN